MMIRTIVTLLALVFATHLSADEWHREKPDREEQRHIEIFEPFEFDPSETTLRTRQRLMDWIKRRIDEEHEPESLFRFLRRDWEKFVDQKRRHEEERLRHRPAQRQREIERFNREMEELRSQFKDHAQKLHAARREELQRQEELKIRKASIDLARHFRAGLEQIAKRRSALEKGQLSQHFLEQLRSSGLDDETIETRRSAWLQRQRAIQEAFQRRFHERRRTIPENILKRQYSHKRIDSSPKKEADLDELRKRGYSDEDIRQLREFLKN
jgi:hypothetical protein